jgi:cutinase
MHNAIPALPADIRNSFTAGLLFGDTKNKQSGGKITNWPAEKLKIFCAKDDGVCDGGLNVNAGHVSYLSSGDLQKGVQYLIEKIDAALASGI